MPFDACISSVVSSQSALVKIILKEGSHYSLFFFCFCFIFVFFFKEELSYTCLFDDRHNTIYMEKFQPWLIPWGADWLWHDSVFKITFILVKSFQTMVHLDFVFNKKKVKIKNNDPDKKQISYLSSSGCVLLLPPGLTPCQYGIQHEIIKVK